MKWEPTDWKPKRRSVALKGKPRDAVDAVALALAAVAGIVTAAATHHRDYVWLAAIFMAGWVYFSARRWRRNSQRAGGVPEFAHLGIDGCQLPGCFVPWSEVADVVASEDGAALRSSMDVIALARPSDTLGFIELAKRYIQAHRARPASDFPELAWREGESAEKRQARLEAMFGERDFRSPSVGPARLIDFLRDPRHPAKARVSAARLLVRVQPDADDEVQAISTELAEKGVAEAMAVAIRSRD